MTITTSVPTSTRRPGTFFEFNIASAARGLAPLQTRLALIGTQDSTATKTATTVNQVFSEADADLFWGVGSPLALMAKFALRAGTAFGKAAEVWGVGIADPGGTAATGTFTVAGTATESGEIILGIAGRTIRAAVASGDSSATVATSIKDAIDELTVDLPVTAGVAASVVTTTHVVTGTGGNDVLLETIDDSLTGITVTAVTAAGGAGTTDITTSLDVLADKDYDVVAIDNHGSADISDFTAHLDSMFNAGTKRWRHTMLADTVSLATGQALATAADDFRQMVVEAEGFRNTEGEIAAYVGMIIASEDDPALPFNNVELPDLTLPDAADIPTNVELESGIGGGLLMLSGNANLTKATIIRAVTTKVTEASVPFFALLDVTISKSLFFTARQVDIAESQAFPRAKKSNRTKRSIRAVVLSTLEDLEELEIVQNVDENAGELVVEDDLTLPDRVNVAIPASIVPPLNQTINVLNLLLQ